MGLPNLYWTCTSMSAAPVATRREGTRMGRIRSSREVSSDSYRYSAVAVKVTEPAPAAEATTVWVPTAGPSIQKPEQATPSAPVAGGKAIMPSCPPPVITVSDTFTPMIRFPAASFTLVQRGSGSRDPAGPDWPSPEKIVTLAGAPGMTVTEIPPVLLPEVA